MKRLRYVMIGGFLGAGKTTLIGRLARHYADRGLKVGIVTNDQAFGLVDTLSLRAQGFEVGEVTGACFCCKFNDLIDVVAKLSSGERPDLILAEPVGSCTDLAATVLEPLRNLYGAEVELAPLTVLLKPEHGDKILGDRGDVGFSAKAAYIFLKQIEEADVVAINKIDKLSAGAVARLTKLLGDRFPGKEVLAVSARTGAGLERLIGAVDRPESPRTRTPEMDYDVYAEGEAELGWLNCSAAVRGAAAETFPLDAALIDLVERLAQACRGAGAEPAHLKILAANDGDLAVANWVCSTQPPELSIASEVSVDAAELTVNARVAVAPEELETLVRRTIAEWAGARKLTQTVENMQRFRPGRPMPTHRMPLGQGA
jgi:Ni2+-binding GTPase involved in maturation of urease and hydrogenase